MRRLTYILLTLAAILFLPSCINDFDECDKPKPLDGEVRLRFTLRLDPLGDYHTRAEGESGVWNPDENGVLGNTFDNSIINSTNKGSVKWLHMLVINSSDEIAYLNLDNSSFTMLGGGLYQIDTKLDLEEKNWNEGDYRLMVFANYRERTTDTKDIHFGKIDKLDALKEAISKNTVDWYVSNGTRNSNNVPYIPMWGVKTAKLTDDKAGNDAGEIELLRSVAKIKIELSSILKEAGYQLVKANVDALNKKVFPCPAGWDVATSTVDNNKYNDNALNPNKNEIKNLEVNCPGYDNENDGDETIVFYLPERSGLDSKDKDVITNITVTVKNDIGEEETCTMKIDNFPGDEPNVNYKNGKYTVNRNHLYQFTLYKDLHEGNLSYKLECWNYVPSEIGWTATDYRLTNTDSDAKNCFVTYPAYPSSENKHIIEDNASFADFDFTFKAPKGAVWKAFLIEDGVEYTAEDKFNSTKDGKIVYASAANTPNGFFFGVGNDDDNNNKASTTGVARDTKYNIKVGTRLRTVNFDDNKQAEKDPDNDLFIKLNANGEYWKERNDVPSCYLVVKVAYDGKNFTDELVINEVKKSGNFNPLRYAGTSTRIQIRQLFPFHKYKDDGGNKTHNDDGKLIIGKESSDKDYQSHCWWGKPEGYSK